MKATTAPLYERLIHLRRRYRQENRIANGLIDSAPFVDLVLLLVLFLAVGHTVIRHPGVLVDLPECAFVSGADYQSLVVYVTQEGHLYFGDERTTLEGLEPAFAQAAHENPDTRLLLEADRRVPYQMLVDIYNRAMSAGIQKVILGTKISVREREF